eukprot:6706837-Pyramimonas_sp.AAC.1
MASARPRPAGLRAAGQDDLEADGRSQVTLSPVQDTFALRAITRAHESTTASATACTHQPCSRHQEAQQDAHGEH